MAAPLILTLADKGIEKVAHRLGIAAAPALVGWTYQNKNNKAFPDILGVVVAAEHAELLYDVYFDEMSMKEKEKEDKKAQAKAQEKKLEAKKKRIAEYVDSTYKQCADDMANNHTDQSLSAESILTNDEDTSYKTLTKTPSLTSPTKRIKPDTTIEKIPSNADLNTPAKKLEDSHFHVFPNEHHSYDTAQNTWYKSCACGFSVPFEKM